MKKQLLTFMVMFLYFCACNKNITDPEKTIDPKWKASTGGEIHASPAIDASGNIYVGSDDGKLYAFNHAGNQKWEYATGGKIESSPAIDASGNIYVGSQDNNIYAIDKNGNLIWKYATDDEVFSSPTIGDEGTVYVGSADGRLLALNSDGSRKWQKTFIEDLVSLYKVYTSPAIGSNGIIYMDVGSYLYAFHQDGTERWKCEVSLESFALTRVPSPAVGSDGTVYVGGLSLHAVTAKGSLKWKHDLETEDVCSSPVIDSDGTLYFGTTSFLGDGPFYLYAVSSDGAFQWKYQVKGAIGSVPAIGSDGTIYFSANDGYLYALNNDGSLKWKARTNNSISSPVIGNDGMIYIGSTDNNLYAFEGSGSLADSPWPMFKRDIQHTGQMPFINTSPTADFVVTPQSGTISTSFCFDASSCYDNENNLSLLQIRWDWENDGIWDTDYSTIKTATHQYSTLGTKTTKLEVKDTDGIIDTIVKQIIVSTPPIALFTVTPDSGTTETTFQFDASGCSDNADPLSALQVRWDWENDGIWDTDYSTIKTATHQYSTLGNKTIKLEVMNTDVLTTTTNQILIIFNIIEWDSMTDQDGNVYKTVKIGNQWWMAENLKVTHYRNGDPITNVTDDTVWANLSEGAYCAYENNESYADTFGYLYNWYAVNDNRNIAPQGWHVSTDYNWQELEIYLGMDQSEANSDRDRGTDEGGKLKETGTIHWNSPNTGATNESGFTALPAGERHPRGSFYQQYKIAFFWTATDKLVGHAYNRYMTHDESYITRGAYPKELGFSIRLVRD